MDKTSENHKEKTNESSAQQTSSTQFTFPVVGLGASAGGLEAFRDVLRSLPGDTGMAYVCVQHLEPTHASMLPVLLARVTQMEVHEAREGMAIEANHVYVIPSNADLLLEQGELKLRPRAKSDGQHLSIDTFFLSLARCQAPQIVGVLLSGTGSDGTLGLQAIQEQGGITLAQNAQSAAYSGMPQSAIDAGYVDTVGSPEEIVKELIKISRYPSMHLPSVTQVNEEAAADKRDAFGYEQEFQQILRLLYRRTKVDFTAYKLTTIKRRIQRRMLLHQISNFAGYLDYLTTHQAEVGALYEDLLIGVTSFFRNPATAELLVREVFPRFLEKASAQTPIRVWVPGCSSGEEVYSLAISLLEFLAERNLSIPLQFFGTDLNPRAIDHARMGIYPAGVLRDVSPARLERFFRPANGSYQIDKSIRELCVFAQHNVLTDPPFAHLDLLSCQNVLIYLKPEVQKNLLQMFHYALEPRGFLLLGSSETAGNAAGLFTPVTKHTEPLYVKQVSGAPPVFTIPLGAAARQVEAAPAAEDQSGWQDYPYKRKESTRVFDAQKEADALLLSRYAPASVVINGEMEILYVRGRTGPYLEPASGAASLNLFKMVRGGLDLELRTAISQAKKSGRAVKRAGIRLLERSDLGEITVEVIPLKAPALEHYFVILFEGAAQSQTFTAASPMQAATNGTSALRAKRGAKDRRIQQSEQELADMREHMRAIIEEMEASNEELQSSNEEVLSSNEELQSLNEEMESSKEEIQAANEELLVLNQELKQRNKQLHSAAVYAEAIVETVQDPLLVLDDSLRVRSANKAFYQVFEVDAAHTVNHFLYDLGNGQWNIPALRTLLEEVPPTNRVIDDYQVEHDFPRIGHKTMLLNAHHVEQQPLILLAIEDITARKQAAADQQRLVDLVENSTDMIGYTTLDGQSLYINEAGLRLVGLANVEEAKRTHIRDFFPLHEQADLLPTIQQSVLAHGYWLGECCYRYFQTGAEIPVYLNMFLVNDHATGQPSGFAMVSHDLTEQKQSAQLLEENAEHLRFLSESMPEKVWTATPDGDIDYMNEHWFSYTGLPFTALQGWGWRQIIHPNDWDLNQSAWQQSIHTGERFEVAHRLRKADGEYRWHLTRGLPQRDNAGRIVRWVGTSTDIDDQRKLLEQREEFLRIASHELRTPVTSLKGYTQMLQMRFTKEGDEYSAGQLSKMDEQINKLTKLISELLDVAKIEAGQLDWNHQQFDLNDLVREYVEELGRTSKKHQIRIEGAVGTPVYGDADRIGQVLTNLLSNAIKYSPDANEVQVSLDADTEFATVGVQDFGIGIAPEHQEHIFERFFRASNPAHSSFPGLGFGLYISLLIVQRHGGRMWVESHQGEGSTFFFTIPLTASQP
ncbi:MAG TPA: chemotaxis protein CheB [Ktedonobacteraceae bacterium]|nr:chemotaxis protein CheB [Ktedonobacteraceae bacterium]